MTTSSQSQFLINGVIDTSQSVLSNIQTIASAAGAWLTYDIHQGKWAVVINKTGSSIASFNDSNIIGGINISSTGLTEVYNSVEVEFPHADIKDRKDYITLEIPSGDRYPNEPDNKLQIRFDIVNNPVQAELLASRELKQSRIDKVIEFRADYSYIGLKAGDLIDVTNDVYGFTNKVFRIIRIDEDDSDDGLFTMNITALEYDEDVYDSSGLTRSHRSVENGIISKKNNSAATSKDNQASVPIDLSNIALASGLLLTFNALTGRWQLSQAGSRAQIAGDHAVITWTFANGQDLDIRCGLIYPNINLTSIHQYIGYTGSGTALGNYWSDSTSSIGPAGSQQGVPISTDWLIWGGDNQGAGSENVYVNLSQLKASFPTSQYFIIECLGNWYGTPGISPVLLDSVVYQGGSVSVSGYGFSVSGYASARKATGVEVYIDSNTTDENAIGSVMGYFVFDVVNNTAQFYNDLNDIYNQFG